MLASTTVNEEFGNVGSNFGEANHINSVLSGFNRRRLMTSRKKQAIDVCTDLGAGGMEVNLVVFCIGMFSQPVTGDDVMDLSCIQEK